MLESPTSEFGRLASAFNAMDALEQGGLGSAALDVRRKLCSTLLVLVFSLNPFWYNEIP